MAKVNWAAVKRKQQERTRRARAGNMPPRTPRAQPGLGAPRWLMRAKHEGWCGKCGEQIAVGQWIHWGPDEAACHKWCKRDRLALIGARARLRAAAPPSPTARST